MKCLIQMYDCELELECLDVNELLNNISLPNSIHISQTDSVINADIKVILKDLNTFNHDIKFTGTRKIHGGDKEYLRIYAKEATQNTATYLCFKDQSIIAIERDRIICYYASPDSECIRLLLKNIMLEELYSQGWLPIHAAAVELKNQGILILGSKGSGKTTKALSLFFCGLENNWQPKFVSNDRVLIKRSHGAWVVLNQDTVIRIYESTKKVLMEQFNLSKNYFRDSFRFQNEKYHYRINRFFRYPEEVSSSTRITTILNCECSDYSFEKLKASAVIDDFEEHPNWIGITERNNNTTKDEFLNSDIGVVCFPKVENIKSETDSICKRMLSIE